MNFGTALLLARGSLQASGLRLALTLACIALGVALAAAVHTVHSSALAEIDRSARALSGAADLEIRGPRSGFDEALFLQVAARPEVAVASPVVEVEAMLAEGDGTLRILGLDPFRARRLQPAFAGSVSGGDGHPGVSLLDPDAVWLSPAAANRLGLAPRARLAVVAANARREYRVAGLLPGLDAAGDVAVLDIAAVQEHFDRVGRLTRIDLRVKPGVDDARLRRELQGLLPAGVGVAPAAAASGHAAAISRAYRVNLDALALVALATGAFLVFSTLALQAARRRQEFALLRAMGVTRRGLSALLVMEGAVVGAVGAALGIALGLAGSRVLLARAGTDLGAGYFTGHGGAFAVDVPGLAVIALLGIAMAVAGAGWVARGVGRMAVADALRDRALDLPAGARAGWAAPVLALAGVPLLFAPPVGGLPLAGYAAIALWLAAAVALVGPVCRALLARLRPASPVVQLALAQVRHLPGHLAASVAGIVVSASLCVAMAIMVLSFRASLEDWLAGVVGADLYARASSTGDSGFFDEEAQRLIAAAPGVARVEFLRHDRLVAPRGPAPLSLVVRPIDARVLASFRAEPAGMPPREAGVVPVWISEAARDLQGWRPGDRFELAIAGRPVPVRVAGVIRDFARTWGAVLMDPGDYRALTGDTRANDAAIHLAPGRRVADVERAVREALPRLPGLQLEDAVELRRRSLAIFDRSFAVTYALEAIAIFIALAGVTSSFAALAWSRRREFGVLRFLGLTRREVLRLLAFEGAAAGSLGAALGLAAGIAISLVLIHVVNRQSFHWSIEVHWPVLPLAALVGALVVACAFGARVSGALAVRDEAILAVKDDA